MGWEFAVALMIAIPVVCFPVVFIWLVNIRGLYHVLRETRRKWAAAYKGKTTKKRFAETTCSS